MNEWASDIYFMQCAILEAKKAAQIGEVPIGAVVVHNGKIIGRGYNRRETTQRASMHAEMLAIDEACRAIGSWRLEETTLYVTLEPCMMCSGAIMQSRIPRVVYAAHDAKGGTVRSLYQLLEDERLNHTATIETGLFAERCGRLLSDFFRELRRKKKAQKRETLE